MGDHAQGDGMTIPLPRDPEPLAAECAACDDWRESDRLTIEEALHAGWAVIDGAMYCTDHLVPCSRCGEACLLEKDGCVRDGDWHCSDCGKDCGYCGRYEAQEREPGEDY